MSTRKLLAFDLDGTVVPRDQVIPDAILRAIHRAEALGHLVTVVTGRTETSAKPFLDQLDIKHPFGTAQGARISTPAGEVLFETKLEPALVRRMIDHADEHALEYFVATGEHFFVRNPEFKTRSGAAYWDWAFKEGHNVTAYSRFADQLVYKVVFHAHQSIQPLASSLRQHWPDLMYYPWETRFLEVTASDAHKGAALERIAQELGVAQADVIAFGDGNNDLTMLEWAGHGVAVGFAEAHEAGVAQETIAPPEEHGVAAWLETNLLALEPTR